MDILDIIGDFGRYQMEVLAIFIPRTLICSFTFHLVHVASTEVDYWCKPPAGFSNLTQMEWKECCLPKKQNAYGRCQRYEGTYFGDLDNTSLVDCHEWDYEGSIHDSMKSEWDLVCDRKWLLSQLYAMFFFGNLVSFPISGYLTDRFGRKTMVLWGCIGLLFTNTALYFVKSLKWFLVIRFLTGLPYTFLQSGTVTYFIEITGQRRRSMVMLFTGTTWALFSMLLLGLSIIVSDWRILVLISSFPICIPYLALCWKFLTESPRWLIAKGKLEEAKEVLLFAAEKNGNQVHDVDSLIEALKLKTKKGNEEEITRGGFVDFFKDKRLLGMLILFAFSNFVNLIASSGFVIALRSLGGNFYINFVLSFGLLAVVSCVDTYVLRVINRRKQILATSFALSGALYLVTTALGNADLQWVRITVAMMARIFNCLVFQTLDIYENETFPTSMRARGFTLCLMAGRVGALCSSFIDLLSQVHGRNAPYYLFGGLCLLTSVAYLFAPDMDNKVLPDTVVDTQKNITNHNKQEEANGGVEMQNNSSMTA